MQAPPHRDLRAELVADLEQIEDNVLLYKAGRNSAFQTVALQLRNLLLGARRGLLLRVLPDANFHPIADKDASDKPGPTEPGVSRVTLFGHAEYRPPWRGERASLTLPIDEEAEALSPAVWLQQWTVRPDVKIEALIRSTADEEVAHTVSERGDLLKMLAGSGVWLVSPEDMEAGRLDEHRVAQETYQMAIIAIGEYVARRVRWLLAASGS